MVSGSDDSKKSIELLQEDLKKYFFIVNSSLEGMSLINRNYVYEAVNEYFCRIHRTQRVSIVGRTVSEVWGEERFENNIRAKIDRAFAGEVGRYNEWFDFGSTGTKYISNNYYPYRDDRGEIVNVVVLSHDISEVQEISERNAHLNQLLSEKNEALEEEIKLRDRANEFMRRYEFIVNSSQESMTLISRNFRYKAFNKYFCDLHGKTEVEVFNLTVADIWGEERFESFIKPRLLKCFEGKNGHYEDSFDFGRHGKRHIATNYYPYFDEKGVVTLVAVISHDITPLKEALEKLADINHSLTGQINYSLQELREKDHMMIIQSRQAAMGEMLSNIAHQWRQPLNALGFGIQGLEAQYEHGDLTGHALKERIDKLMGIIIHMSQTIDDFRDFFKPAKEKVPFRFKETLEKAAYFVQSSFSKYNIEIRVDASPFALIVGYPNEFLQVALNILNNSRDELVRKKIPNGLITIDCRETGEAVTISFLDNAGGIPEDIIGRIFEPYFTTKDEGTGIGLYMSRTIVEKHLGGKITASNKDGGALFTIEIPKTTGA